MKKKAIGVLLFVFLYGSLPAALFALTETVPAPVAAPELVAVPEPVPVVVAGTIQKVRTYDHNHYELKIKTEAGIEKYLISRATQIHQSITAEKLEVGHRILLTGEWAQKKIQGLAQPGDPDGPRANVPGSMANMLEQEPQVPGQEKDPQAPKLPEEVQKAKEDVEQRDPPNQPTPEELAKMKQEQGQPPAGGPPPGGGGGEQKKKEEPQEAVIPKEMSYPVPAPDVLFAATAEDLENDVVTDTIVKKETTANGVAIQLAQIGENLTVPSAQPMMRIIQMEDVREGMQVQIEETGENNFIRKLMISAG